MYLRSDAASYYLATANRHESFAPLGEAQEARVVVVGGGYAGLNTALGLAERGVRDVVLLECEHLGFGASGRNGGFVFAGYSLGEQSLLRQLGQTRARALYHRTVDAVELVRQRVARYAIDCDAVDEGVYWANWFRDPSVLRERQQLLADCYGERWEWVAHARLRELVRSERYTDALYERNALHLHPLNYALGIARSAAQQGVRIHESTPAVKLERRGQAWRVCTPHGYIDAQTVVLACGGYLAGLNRRVDRAVLPIATYVMATEPLGARLDECFGTRAAVYDTRFAFDYYRPLKDTRILWGGRISIHDREPMDVAKILKRDLLEVFPQLHDVRIDYAWSGLMSYARHQMPQLGTRGDGLWWIQAFGGHGVSSTTALGELLAAAIAQNDAGWRELADFGLVESFRPLGFLGAEASYCWYRFKDWYKERGER
jgi:gamma-glutamylputrescine oxidase